MNRNTAYNEAFARIATQLGMITATEVRELGVDGAAPEWDRIVGKAGLDKIQINMIEAELVRLVEVCTRCRNMRYRVERSEPLTTPCPRCVPPPKPAPDRLPSSRRGPARPPSSGRPQPAREEVGIPPAPSSTRRKARSAFGAPRPSGAAREKSVTPLRKRDETGTRKRGAIAERWREPARPVTKRINRDVIVQGGRPSDVPKPRSGARGKKKGRKTGAQAWWTKPRVIGPGLAVLLLVVGWVLWPAAPVRYPPGVQVAPHGPTVGDADRGEWKRGAFEITPLRSFAASARVLEHKSYAGDREAEVAPIDLLLGWGPMSDQEHIDRVDYQLANRSFTWWYDADMRPETIILHSALLHIIPVHPSLVTRLAALRSGELISLSGYLVEVRTEDGWTWRSSTSFNDAGSGSTEILWLESFTVKPRP